MTKPPKVTFLVAGLFHYRVRFHELVRETLARRGVDYEVAVSPVRGKEHGKADTVDLPWVRPVKEWRLAWRGRELIYQRFLLASLDSDLVIAMQENKFLINYALMALSRITGPRIAMFGHGRDYQSRSPDGLMERWKRWWSMRWDWWFAYTDTVRDEIAAKGFPLQRITVFNNAVDTAGAKRHLAAITQADLEARRVEAGLEPGPVGVFVGGLYDDKRLGFLIEAAHRVRAAFPDFQLLIIGGGPEYPAMQRAAAETSWIKAPGPRFGREKVELMRLAKLCLNPGLVGLVVLDCSALGLPLVTTDYPFHSPELAYLEPGVSGVVVAGWNDVDAYAQAICELLGHPENLVQMSQAASRLADVYTIEAMAERFSDGVMAALQAPKRR
jgi:glycosyltransferase involved in cell wall biosynthesis